MVQVNLFTNQEMDSGTENKLRRSDIKNKLSKLQRKKVGRDNVGLGFHAHCYLTCATRPTNLPGPLDTFLCPVRPTKASRCLPPTTPKALVANRTFLLFSPLSSCITPKPAACRCTFQSQPSRCSLILSIGVVLAHLKHWELLKIK